MSVNKHSSGIIICTKKPSGLDDERTVAWVTISNVQRLNSLNSTLITKLTSTLRNLATDPQLSAVVIKGAIAKNSLLAFSSGSNIFEMDETKTFTSRLQQACQAARDLPVVTIAQIRGLCFGGVLELAAACDFRHATRRSSFSVPGVRFGIPSVIEARLLPNIIGFQKTKQLLYLAKFYSAEEMGRWADGGSWMRSTSVSMSSKRKLERY